MLRGTLTLFFFFFFNDTATTEIYPLSLHDALPIFSDYRRDLVERLFDQMLNDRFEEIGRRPDATFLEDRKSTRLNSSHSQISYAVFCLKKKKQQHHEHCYAPTRHTSFTVHHDVESR